MTRTVEVKSRYEQEYRPLIRRGGELRLSYYSQQGKYNLLSDEITTMCHVKIYENGKVLAGVSVEVERVDEYTGSDVDEIVSLIDEDARRHWIDTAAARKQAVKNFILVNRDAIELGNAKHEIDRLVREIEVKSARLEVLTRFVRECAA